MNFLNRIPSITTRESQRIQKCLLAGLHVTISWLLGLLPDILASRIGHHLSAVYANHHLIWCWTKKLIHLPVASLWKHLEIWLLGFIQGFYICQVIFLIIPFVENLPVTLSSPGTSLHAPCLRLFWCIFTGTTFEGFASVSVCALALTWVIAATSRHSGPVSDLAYILFQSRGWLNISIHLAVLPEGSFHR